MSRTALLFWFYRREISVADKPSKFAAVTQNVFRYLKKKDDEAVERQPVLGYRGRQLIILLAFIAFSLFVGYNLLKFTVLDGDKWRQLANAQQMASMTIKASRGTIYDTNGTVLAQSSTVWNVIIAPQAIYKKNDERRKAYDKEREKWLANNDPDKDPLEDYRELSDLICNGLADILEIEPDNMLKACDERKLNYIIAKHKVDKATVMEIQQFLLKNKISSDCVYTEETSRRYYPNGTLASTVIGFTNFDGNGVYGLEAYYDDYLRGVDGKAFYTKDGLGQGIEYANDNYFSAIDGNSLVLTLDEVLQHYVEKNLEKCVSQHAVINRAVGIIMDCNTGGVLAMATTPSYDLNNPSTIVGSYELGLIAQKEEEGASEEEIKEFKAVLREQQWKNKAVNELYYPGSVFKTVTCAAGLDQEVVNLNSEFTCAGAMNVAGTTIHCWKHAGHGTLNLQGAISASCNPSFMQIGALLGVDKFSDYFESFGFTEKTGIDLPSEAQSLYIPRSRMGPVELATCAFGQSNKITPIQMCTAICALVNGGYLVTPHLVDKILDSNGNVIETKETEIKRQVISKDTCEQMKAILEEIVNFNGGSNAYIQGYRIGGKSGTAERIDEYNAAGGAAGGARMTFVSTFAAAVPMENPQIVMLVAADTPTGTQYYGSAVAAPVVSAVFREGLEHLGIYPTYTKEEQEKMDAVVPYVLGNLSMKAESLLAARGFEAKLVGAEVEDAVVTNQVPSSGASIPKGSTVVLYFGDAKTETGSVPNVIGKSAAEANEIITNAGFNIKITGGAAQNVNAVAVSQSYVPGLVINKGAVIEVEFRYDSRSD